MPPIMCSKYQQAVATARSQLDETTFTEIWTEGQAMTLEKAVAYALNE
jgi:hypothetical protein